MITATETASPGRMVRAERARTPRRLVLMWTGATIGAIVLWTAVVAGGVLTWDYAGAGADIAAISIGLAITIIAGVVFGAGMIWVSARAFAKVNLALLALTLVTGGVSFMAAAPVVRQMDTPGLAEYTGYTALLIAGAAATVAGLALAGLCVRWSMTKRARRALAGWSRLLGSAYGVALALTGFGTLTAFTSLINGEATFDAAGGEFSVVEQAISFAVIAALTLLPGIILTYHGISASMGEGSSAFRAPVAAVAAAAFGAVLLAGQADMRMESPIAAPMPPLHVLAALLPGLTYTALAARGSLFAGEAVRGLTWRQVTLAAAISMSVGVAIALYVEIIGSYIAVALLLVHNGAFAYAYDAGTAWDFIASYPEEFLTDREQFVAGLVTASLLAPVAEEFGKSLGVRFMMHPNTTRAQCFLLGAFAGAGFGFLESLLYGLAGVGDDLSFWWAIMLIRGGSTSLHVICTGLAGVGWWYWTRARRHRVALALFGTAMLIHATWNAFATVLESRILFLDTIDSTLLEVISYVIIAAFSLVMIAAIPTIARGLREQAPAVGGTPLASMAPWLG